MKQGNLAISFEEEKLAALRRYMGKKELDLEAEMTDALAKLYDKYVPAPVREYIDETDTQIPKGAVSHGEAYTKERLHQKRQCQRLYGIHRYQRERGEDPG